MEGDDKLDNIKDGFIHYHLLRFCMATRLQYLNGHVQLENQNAPASVVPNMSTTRCLCRNKQDRAWVDMRLHEFQEEGGFGDTHNTVSWQAASYTTNARLVAFLGTFARPAQQVWVPGSDLQDQSTWDALHLCTLKRLHKDLLQNYDCSDQPASAQPAPPSGAGGGGVANAGSKLQSQHADFQDNSNGKLFLPQLNHPHEAFKPSQVPPSASSSSQDQQPNRPNPILTQRRLTQQLSKHWPQFNA
jgi:hypothetical protein